MARHRGLGCLLHGLRVALALRLPFGERPALRQIAVDRVMRRGLIGDDVGPHAPAHELREDIRRVAEDADRDGLLLAAGALDDLERLVERGGLLVEIARAQAHLDARGLAFDGKQRRPSHGRRERLRAAHAAEPRGQDPFAGEVAADNGGGPISTKVS